MRARKVGLYGTGKAAGQIVRALNTSAHTLTAAISFLETDAGKDIGTLVGHTRMDVRVSTDLVGAIRSGEFEVLLYAGLSGDTLYRAMELCAEVGVDLVHACFVHPRLRLEKAMYSRLQQQAETSGSRIVGTGMLPGFWLDVLPALLISALPAPVTVVGQACSDITSWGTGVLKNELRLGTPVAGELGPIGGILQESAEMIAEVMGVSGVVAGRHGGFAVADSCVNVMGIDVQPGDRVGFDEYVVVAEAGVERVRLGWTGLPGNVYQDFERSLSLKLIGADGTEVVVHLDTPEDPYPGTAARFIQAIHGVEGLPGGLLTPVQLRI